MKVYEMTIADIASEIFDKGEDFAEKIFNDIDELEKNKFLEINKLKQQLAEKDKNFQEYRNEVVSNIEKEVYERMRDTVKEYEMQLAEKDKEIAHLKEKDNYHLRYELAGADETITNLKKQLEEKDKEIEDLKKWQDWYSMWHKEFQKQIEDLTTELETYRPTKLHGNGQCKCFNCNAINWTDWCSSYKGHTYCDDCLKEILKEEQTPQTKLAIQELEKVNGILTDTIIEVTQNEFDLNKLCYLEEISAKFYEKMQEQINELKGEKQ